MDVYFKIEKREYMSVRSVWQAKSGVCCECDTFGRMPGSGRACRCCAVSKGSTVELFNGARATVRSVQPWILTATADAVGVSIEPADVRKVAWKLVAIDDTDTPLIVGDSESDVLDEAREHGTQYGIEGDLGSGYDLHSEYDVIECDGKETW